MRRQHGAADLESYERVGSNSRRDILSLLPADWSFAGNRVLDFASGAGRTVRHFLEEAETCELWAADIDQSSTDWLRRHLVPPLHVLRNDPEPPLDLPDGYFDLIWSISLFTHLTDGWARWLCELHRLLADEGRLIVTYAGAAVAAARLAEPWNEDERGMFVSHHWRSFADSSGPAVLHSRWWLEEHWGRAFEILEHRPSGFAGADGGQGILLLRPRPGRFSPQELERTNPAEPREAEALRRQVGTLLTELEALRAARSPGSHGATEGPTVDPGERSAPPLPPRALMTRIAHTAQLDRSDEWLRNWYDRMGAELKAALMAALPSGYSLEGKRVLDFGCGPGRVLRHFLDESRTAEFWGCDRHAPSIAWLRSELSPPMRSYVNHAPSLPHPDDHLDLVYGISVFTHITHEWSAWLLELHRVLKPGGLLFMTFMGPQVASFALEEPVTEADLGMTALKLENSYDDNSGPLVLHSEWWLRAHWGRAFEELALVPRGFASASEISHGYFLGGKKDVALDRDDLERPESDEPRELRAARSQIRLLEADATALAHRLAQQQAELDALRQPAEG
jgi:SAM-dependent methyltransferase